MPYDKNSLFQNFPGLPEYFYFEDDFRDEGRLIGTIVALTNSTGRTPDDTLANHADLTTYATDAAVIEANVADLGGKINEIIAKGGWIGTALSSGTCTLSDALNGVVSLANAATTDNSGYQIQDANETFILTAGKPIEMIARVRILDDDNSNLIVGLASRDTTLLDASGITASADVLGFMLDDGSTTLKALAITSAATAGTANAATIVDSQWYTLGLRIEPDGTTATTIRVQAYVDGNRVAEFRCTGASSQELCPTLAYVSGTNVTAGLDVDYIAIRQLR